MRKINWNEGWLYRHLDSADALCSITVPYDCMLHEERSDDAPGGCNNGWFTGYDYEFIKALRMPETVPPHLYLEMEGVYHRAEVYVNGKQAAYRPNGYLGLTADIAPLLHTGENQVRVIARGADIPNARWYTGVGIYRDVWLHEAGERHIRPDGLRITTLGIDPAKVRIDLDAVGKGRAKVSILRDEQTVAQGDCDVDGTGSVTLTIPNAALWSPDEPNLYTCRVDFAEDVTETVFGIRTVSCDAKNGLCINGKRVILRGACVHHDNGLLGAASLPEAEERKIRLLRQAGFNAIRSSHNPCSKVLLDVCDRHGMLVMDEYADSWYIHKTKHDYATYMQEWYPADLKDMAAKDYNHPCVVLYSLGNEVTETVEKRGVDLFCAMRDCLRSHDATRPITCGINIGFNQAAMTGNSFFSDEKAAKNDFKNLGTEDANHRKWRFGPLFTKLNAILPGCDRATRDIFRESDVAGYNYGVLRYGYDRWKYPERAILGSETFCEDAQRFWRIANRDKGIIGDFVWTGIDHLGEVGLGAWEYKDYAPTYIHTKGWLTSGVGRIDVTGKLLPEAYYMLAAYGLLKKPCIGVLPPHHMGERHSPSGWKFTNAVESWAWEGCEGMQTRVEVYGCGDHVELYLNGHKVGKRSLRRNCRAQFSLSWQPGVLTAIVFDKGGEEISRACLHSAEKETQLRIDPEEPQVKAGGLCYLRLRLTDVHGTTKVMERERIRVTVEGGELIGLGHACPYNDDGYVSDATGTYWGEALAIVRAGEKGALRVVAAVGALQCQASLDVC